jgi:hypothetical protein
MSQIKTWKGMKLETPATYRIRVQGKLAENWLDRLDNMSITSETPTHDPPVTTLVGHLTDQAALSGLLNTLYEMHLPLLSVENLDEK